MGRMTRLVVLNLSDNKLSDLPVSLGLCYGLAKLGAGIQVERNLIQDQTLLQKYKIGTDHLQDYLEKKMMSMFLFFIYIVIYFIYFLNYVFFIFYFIFILFFNLLFLILFIFYFLFFILFFLFEISIFFLFVFIIFVF